MVAKERSNVFGHSGVVVPRRMGGVSVVSQILVKPSGQRKEERNEYGGGDRLTRA